MNILSVIINENETFNLSSLEIFSFIDELKCENKITSIVFGGEKSVIAKIPCDEIVYVPLNSSVALNPNDVLFSISKRHFVSYH